MVLMGMPHAHVPTNECCTGVRVQLPVLVPFVCFFSGHVANTVIAANHMYLKGNVKGGVILHVLNVLQILRLLSTRGHYGS